jgi:shikimate kinase
LANEGKAVAHGAVTIVNAISCGLGAALGINLWTEAFVKLTNEPNVIEGKIVSDPGESTVLIKKTVSRVLKYFNLENEYGAHVETRSNVPIARGLKSSSVAANAIALATFSTLKADINDITVVNLGVDAALEAKVTITGAFDDACASYFGNVAITDNRSRKILKQFIPEEDYAVLIYVPPKKAYTANSNIQKMQLMAKEVESIHKQALSGEYWTAMTLNGLVYSTLLGYDPTIAIEALSAGAIAAGLSGKGPAVAAVASTEKSDEVKGVWQHHGGNIIEAKINREKARILA